MSSYRRRIDPQRVRRLANRLFLDGITITALGIGLAVWSGIAGWSGSGSIVVFCLVAGVLFYVGGFLIKRSQERKLPGYAKELDEKYEPSLAIERATATRRCPRCGEVLFDTMIICPTCKSPLAPKV